MSFGGELVFVGPNTGLDDFQDWAHERIGAQRPTAAATQLGNKVYPTVHGEVSRDVNFGSGVFRPFVEAQVGIENYARIGFDTVFGKNVSQNFFVRDPVTGHLLTNVRHSDERSFGFMIGGDMAYVGDSDLLPGSRGVEVRDFRPRARAGFLYEGENAGLFYGVTYLGKEFENQREGQFTGSLSVKFNF